MSLKKGVSRHEDRDSHKPDSDCDAVFALDADENGQMKELSLFTGCGGGLLATQHLLGWQTIGYVEINEYCQKIILQRIKDGYLDEAPSFGDIRTFIDQGYAASYQGMVDVITAGFPCQPFSVAGKQRGKDDKRNLWPETQEVIRLVRPRYVLLENVPGLITHQYFGTILWELAESGYCVRWRCLSAAELGAPHKRDRVWILGYSHHNGSYESKITKSVRARIFNNSKEQNKTSQFKGSNIEYDKLADSAGTQDNERERRCLDKKASIGKGIYTAIVSGSQNVGNSNQERLQGCGGFECGARERIVAKNGVQSWWSKDPADDPESQLGRMAYGLAHRVDRLKGIGEGQVPCVVECVWNLLRMDK